ncbi:MAG: EamA family transporter [Mycobacteriales bacterium]
MPALLALLASLLWGTADFLGGTATRRLPVASVVGISQLVALLGLLPVAVLLGALDEPRDYLLPGLAAGSAGVVALAAFYRALAVGTMGVVAPVAALGVVVPVAAGLVQGESPSWLQLVGIAVAVTGVVLASGPELSGQDRGGVLPLVLGGVAALGFGTVFVLIAQGTASGSIGSVVMTLLTMRLVSVLLLAGLLPAVVLRSALPWRRVDIGVRRADLPVLVAIGAFDVGANAAFALAVQSDLISVTAVLASLYPVVTVLLARQVHSERLVGVQLPGVVLALTGVVLLAAG